MRAINDLVTRGPRPELLAFLQRLEGNPETGWRRDREAEARMRSTGGGGEGGFCFRCTETPDRPGASLWLRPRGFEEWRVYSIHPLGKRMLSDEEYNHILADFKSRFLDPISRGSAVCTEIRAKEIRLEDYLSGEAARRLREFSTAANRTSLEPTDRQRWQQFLVRAHRDDTIMDVPFLEAWLASEGWSETMRQELARDYVAVRTLLANYDEEERR